MAIHYIFYVFKNFLYNSIAYRRCSMAYQQSFVCFLDILGFKTFFLNGDINKHEEILNLLKNFSGQNGEYFHQSNENKIRPASLAFSDNLVFSTPTPAEY